MTDFFTHITSIKHYTICIYVKKIWLNFFIVCWFFHSLPCMPSVFSGVLFDYLFLAREFYCLLNCHNQNVLEHRKREKENSCQSCSLFLFLLFDSLAPFCLVLYQWFCYFSSFPVWYWLVRMCSSYNLNHTHAHAHAQLNWTMFIHICAFVRCLWWRSGFEFIGVTVVNT